MAAGKVKIEVYVPESHLDVVRTALGEAGTGRVGRYDLCSSVAPVTGTWRPLEGANPYDGEVGVLQTAPECKLEMLCDAELASAAVQAAKKTHPYEEPVINVIPLWQPD